MRAVLAPVLWLRRTPPAALVLMIVLIREMAALSPSRPAWPSAVPAGSTVTSYRALCYVVADGNMLVPVSLLDNGAFDRRVGVAYRVGTHIRTFDRAPIFDDVGFEVVVCPRYAGEALGDTGVLGPACLQLAEAEWAAARRPEEDVSGLVEEPSGRWDPRMVRRARIGVAAILAADSMLGVGAWWRAIVEWHRRRCRRAAEEARRREGLCRECGYPLEGLPVRRCPECGTGW